MINAFEDLDGVQRAYDWSDIEPAMAILETIAALEYDDVTETIDILDAPLYTYVDLDALNTVVRSEHTDSMTLEVEDYLVQITGNTVGVTPAEL